MTNVAQHPPPPQDGKGVPGPPPDDTLISITLSRSQWERVLKAGQYVYTRVASDSWNPGGEHGLGDALTVIKERVAA